MVPLLLLGAESVSGRQMMYVACQSTRKAPTQSCFKSGDGWFQATLTVAQEVNGSDGGSATSVWAWAAQSNKAAQKAPRALMACGSAFQSPSGLVSNTIITAFFLQRAEQMNDKIIFFGPA
jgi:hypothetical protein